MYFLSKEAASTQQCCFLSLHYSCGLFHKCLGVSQVLLFNHPPSLHVVFSLFSFYSTKPERRQLKFNNGAVLRHSLSSHQVVWRLIVFMRVRFLALGESRQHTVSSIQQTRHECESRRVCEPPGPTTSSLLPLGHRTPTHLRWSKPLGYSAAPWRCPGLDLAGAGAPWQ